MIPDQDSKLIFTRYSQKKQKKEMDNEEAFEFMLQYIIGYLVCESQKQSSRRTSLFSMLTDQGG